MLYHCKVINQNEQDKEKLCVRKLDLMHRLTHDCHQMRSAIIRDEIYNMQTKFNKCLCIIDIKETDYFKMFENHLPYYKEGMFAGLEYDYFKGNEYHMKAVYSSVYPQLAVAYNDVRNDYNFCANEVKNMPEVYFTDEEYSFSLTRKELSKYEYIRKTLGLYYVNLNVVYFNLYDRDNSIFKQNTPAWVTKLEFITDDFYLYELLKYIRKNTKVYKFIDKLLSNGGLKENEFVHLSGLEGDE